MKDLVIIYSGDPDFYMLMSHILATAGYSAILADDYSSIDEEKTFSIAAILFDSGNSIEDVTAFCHHVKANPATEHLRLLALIRAHHEGCYMDLLRAGIDEVLMRPVSPEMVLSCVRTFAEPVPIPGKNSIQSGVSKHFGDFVIDEGTRVISFENSSSYLTPIEFRLLKRFLEAPRRVLSRNDLIETAWPPDQHVDIRTVDVHIARLRRRLEETTGRKIIRTIRSSGFIADIPDDRL